MKITRKSIFGSTGLRVPPVVYGTSYLGNLYTALTFPGKLRLMAKWFECTVKPVVIDTAGKYGAGLALETIGKGLRELGMEPDELIISNKLGWYRVPLESSRPTFEPGVWAEIDNDAVLSFGYEGILKCYRQGNELLGDPYRVDLVSVHDPDEYLFSSADDTDRERRFSEILESYRALFDLKKEGAVRAVGIGSKDWRVIRELYEHVSFDWVMLANSYTIYHHPDELISFVDRLHKDRVGIINSAVFHGGFLTGGRLFDYQEILPGSERGKLIHPWREKFYEICRKHDVQPADACIHFSISHPAIASIALNTSQPEKMNRNAEILEKCIPETFWEDMKYSGLINPKYRYI